MSDRFEYTRPMGPLTAVEPAICPAEKFLYPDELGIELSDPKVEGDSVTRRCGQIVDGFNCGFRNITAIEDGEKITVCTGECAKLSVAAAVRESDR